jgi:Predicted ATPase (AAA+ superfamily)
MTSKPSSSSRGRKQGRGNAGSPRTSYRQRCAVRVTYSGDRVRGPRPAAAEESFEIVRRRLFQPISDPDLFRARDAVVKAFAEMYRKDASEYPSQASQADYERRLKIAYPIHPDLFESLYSDWSRLERFQRTRGVLRRKRSVELSITHKSRPISGRNCDKTAVKCRQDAKTKVGRIVSGYSNGRSVCLRRSHGWISPGGSWELPVSGCQAGAAVSEVRAAARDPARAVDSTCLPGLDQHQGCVPFPFEPESQRGTDIIRAFPSDSRSSVCGGWSDPDSA